MDEKIAYTIEELVERGCGSRTFLYERIGAGELRRPSAALALLSSIRTSKHGSRPCRPRPSGRVSREGGARRKLITETIAAAVVLLLSIEKGAAFASPLFRSSAGTPAPAVARSGCHA